MEKREEIAEINEDALLINDMDEALVGYTLGYSTNAVYDYDTLVHEHIERDGMTEDEAMEYIDYNIIGAYVENGPIVIKQFT